MTDRPQQTLELPNAQELGHRKAFISWLQDPFFS